MVYLAVLVHIESVSIFIFERHNQVRAIRGCTPNHAKVLVTALAVIDEGAISRNFEPLEFAATDEVPDPRHSVGTIGHGTTVLK